MTENTGFKFSCGEVIATRSVTEAVPPLVRIAALVRHLNGDWGDLSEADKAANNEALQNGGRLISAYHAPDGTKFWIITEADRSFTTYLLPDEY